MKLSGRPVRRWLLAMAAVALLVLAGCEEDATVESSSSSSPAGGLPDISFNDQGWITYGFAASGLSDDFAFDLAVDASNRIVLTGQFSSNTTDPGNMGVMRLLTDGSVDPAFNGGAPVTFDGGTVTLSDVGYGVKIDPQNRIVVAGRVFDAVEGDEFTIWRLNANGTYNTPFGASGVNILPDLGGISDIDVAFDVTTDPLGNVIVGGLSVTAGSVPSAALVQLREADGGFDLGFNSGSPLLITAAAYQDYSAVMRDSAGNVVVAGWETCPAGQCPTISRYDSVGNLDTALFNASGPVPGVIQFYDAALQPPTPTVNFRFKMVEDSSNRIVIVGTTRVVATGDHDVIVIRLTNAGLPDTTFGGTGIVRIGGIGPTDQNAHAVALDQQGKILIVGEYENADLDMVIWRLTTNGQLDNTFGQSVGLGGYLIVDDSAGGGGNDGAYAVAVQPNGRIVVAGYSEGPGTTGAEIAVWRFQ